MQLPKTDDVPELTLMEDGEHELQIVSVSDEPAKTGRGMITLGCKSMSQENTEMLFHRLFLPTKEEMSNDKAKADRFLRDIQQFTLAIGADPANPPSTNELKGLTFTAIIGKEEGDDGVVRDKIKKYI